MSIAISDYCNRCGGFWHLASYPRDKYEQEGLICPDCELKENNLKKKLIDKPIDNRFEILDL